jgi:DNA-binding CsgD family transcriptional regulator
MREAIIDLSDDELAALGFGDLVPHVREAGVREVEMLEDDGFTCVPQVEVERRLDGDLRDDLECVEDWELVAERGNTYRYLPELTAVGLPQDMVEAYDDVIGTSDPAVSDQGLLLSFVGSQDAIRGILRHFEAAGTTPSLRKLTEYEGDDSTTTPLTDRQFEVTRTAYELGFYEIPREASTADVADELDLDPATVSEHLQRAERNILARELPC